jgi:hypothetical protein
VTARRQDAQCGPPTTAVEVADQLDDDGKINHDVNADHVALAPAGGYA